MARGPALVSRAARVAGVGRLHELDLVPGAALVRKDELAVLEGALGAADTEFFSLVKVERALSAVCAPVPRDPDVLALPAFVDILLARLHRDRRASVGILAVAAEPVDVKINM